MKNLLTGQPYKVAAKAAPESNLKAVQAFIDSQMGAAVSAALDQAKEARAETEQARKELATERERCAGLEQQVRDALTREADSQRQHAEALQKLAEQHTAAVAAIKVDAPEQDDAALLSNIAEMLRANSAASAIAMHGEIAKVANGIEATTAAIKALPAPPKEVEFVLNHDGAGVTRSITARGKS